MTEDEKWDQILEALQDAETAALQAQEIAAGIHAPRNIGVSIRNAVAYARGAALAVHIELSKRAE